MVLTIVAVGVTLGALAYLAATDPKRRRVVDQPPLDTRRRTLLALTATIGPGILLAFIGDAAGFVIWLGAASVGGWGVAAATPERSARARDFALASPDRVARFAVEFAQGAGEVLSWFGGWLVSVVTLGSRIQGLQDRVAELEDQVRELNQRSSGSLLSVSTPADPRSTNRPDKNAA